MAQPPPKAAAATKRRRVLTAPPVWRELLLVVLFYTGYTLTRIVLVQDGTGPAFAHADQILGVERYLGLDVELHLNQTLLSVPWLARAANIFYATMHFIVTLGVVVWLYRYRPEHYRWLRTSIMIATGMALIGFWLYPLAPPRFLHSEGFVDPVTALHSLGLYASDASGTLTNQYAAMPSMHAGWSLWVGIVVVKLATQKWAKALGALYPVTTVYVILSTANHYVLDAVAGFALVGGAAWLSWVLYVRHPEPIIMMRARIAHGIASRVRRGAGEPSPGHVPSAAAGVTAASGATRSSYNSGRTSQPA
ncbi:phosphatase PAP2 family protein [Actinomadura sp. KC06]|uniref:phosphatase PAP2 family protein n=1 Tax=Actinomadura sp. KC06 TaxID=2530369 RepID=UPI001FB8603B|nr:phosphatase PAP2 family protein [Actinomadura sp. KC06]